MLINVQLKIIMNHRFHLYQFYARRKKDHNIQAIEILLEYGANVN